MSAITQAEALQDAVEPGLTPLQARAETYRFALAGTLRSLAAVSNATATNLETHGQFAEVMALIATLDRLRAQTGDQFECFGAALGSCGSA